MSSLFYTCSNMPTWFGRFIRQCFMEGILLVDFYDKHDVQILKNKLQYFFFKKWPLRITSSFQYINKVFGVT